MAPSEKVQPVGMRAFTIVWIGQMVSMMGTGMTRFAITIWAWQITGEATALALVAFFSFGPMVILSPIAGALVDRWNRKLVMMLSDLAAGLSTIIILALFVTDNLQIWHLYAAGAFAGAFEAFQFPAYSAAVSTMVSKDQYTRVHSMIGLGEPTSQIAAPILAGALLVAIGLTGILIIDIVTFLVAIGTLLAVHIPEPDRSDAGREGQGNLWQESLYGFRYIFERPSLLGLQLLFLGGNLTSSMAFVLYPALILARTSNNELILATVQSALGIGGVVGGVVLAAWGGPKRRIHTLLGAWFMNGVGTMAMGFSQQIAFWSIAHFGIGFCIPFINGSNQAIWQSKVPPDIQGRVFATRRLIAQISFPVSMLIVGPLADRVFEPAMVSGGRLVPLFGPFVGIGAGAGMGLMFVLSGLIIMLVGLSGYTINVIRNVEDILPDHDEVT
ncbi:MAG: MFS transporter [Chloroflexota bacterium]